VRAVRGGFEHALRIVEEWHVRLDERPPRLHIAWGEVTGRHSRIEPLPDPGPDLIEDECLKLGRRLGGERPVRRRDHRTQVAARVPRNATRTRCRSDSDP
jgi:hypothetical protein